MAGTRHSIEVILFHNINSPIKSSCLSAPVDKRKGWNPILLSQGKVRMVIKCLINVAQRHTPPSTKLVIAITIAFINARNNVRGTQDLVLKSGRGPGWGWGRKIKTRHCAEINQDYQGKGVNATGSWAEFKSEVICECCFCWGLMDSAI